MPEPHAAARELLDEIAAHRDLNAQRHHSERANLALGAPKVELALKSLLAELASVRAELEQAREREQRLLSELELVTASRDGREFEAERLMKALQKIAEGRSWRPQQYAASVLSRLAAGEPAEAEET